MGGVGAGPSGYRGAGCGITQALLGRQGNMCVALRWGNIRSHPLLPFSVLGQTIDTIEELPLMSMWSIL